MSSPLLHQIQQIRSSVRQLDHLQGNVSLHLKTANVVLDKLISQLLALTEDPRLAITDFWRNHTPASTPISISPLPSQLKQTSFTYKR